jgi:hypothetical protein
MLTHGSRKSVWQLGSTVSGRREREGIPIRKLLLGCGLLAVLAGFVPVAPFLYFSSFLLFPFLSLVYFITFAFWLQFDSNQFQKFSKNQSI